MGKNTILHLYVILVINFLLFIQTNEQIVGYPIKPQKSKNDNRDYQIVILSNSLRVIFIQNQELALAACSACIGAGRLLEKERSKGLAHFLQHMVFMGSKNYPIENQFSSFVRTHSGFDNAYTSDYFINFFHYIQNDAFIQSVERMTDWLISPLIRKQSMQKQRQAVHNQFELRVGDQARKKWQILRMFASRPFSRFNLGNNETLNYPYIRDDLIWYHNKYFSANIMTIAMCSGLPISQMKQKLIPVLSKIPNKKVKIPIYSKHYQKSHLGKFVYVQSIKNQSALQFYFIVDNLRPHYKKHVSQYVARVFENEGKNSLSSILKDKGYAYKIIYFSEDNQPQTIVDVEIKLTKLGEKKFRQVYQIVVDYIQSLEPSESIYNQIRQINKANFDYKQVESVEDYVATLSQKLHYIPFPELLNYSVIFDDFQNASRVIGKILRQLIPQNAIVMFSSPEQLQYAMQQKYLKTKFLLDELPERKKRKNRFPPLPANPYIPIDLTFHQFEDPSLIPQKFNDDIYFLQDSTYRICKGGVQIRIKTYESLEFLDFYSTYLTVLIKQLIYPAQTLSTSISIDISDCLIISIFGFSDIVAKVTQKLAQSMSKIHSGERSQILFDLAHQDVVEAYQNTYHRSPDSLAGNLLRNLLIDRLKTIQQATQQIRGYKYKQVSERIKKFWSNNIVKIAVVGNFEEDRLTHLFQLVQDKIGGRNRIFNIPQYRLLKLKQNIVIEAFSQSQDITSSCAIVYYQAGPYTENLFYRISLLKQLINEPFYNQLRTIKQLAYSLDVSVDNSRGVLGLKFTLVSSSQQPKKISEQIKLFVNSFYGKIRQKLSQNNGNLFTQMKEMLSNQFRVSANYETFFQFIINEIASKTFYFNRYQPDQTSKYIDAMEISDLEQLWADIGSKTVQVYIVSKSHLQQYAKRKVKAQKISDVKKRAEFWDDFLH